MKAVGWFQVGGIVSLVVGALFGSSLLAAGVTSEVPLGSVRGQAIMAENGKPLAKATVVFRPTMDLEDWEQHVRSLKTDSEGRFSATNIPAGLYEVDAFSRAHHLERIKVVVEEGKGTTTTLKLLPPEPHITINAAQRVFLPTEAPAFAVDGFSPVERMKVSVYRIKDSSLMKEKRAQEILWPYSGNNVDARKSTELEPVDSFSKEITERDSEGTFDERLEFNKLPDGIYYVEIDAGKAKGRMAFSVSKIALVTKRSGRECLAYVSDLATGEPVVGSTIFLGSPSGMAPKGKTGSDGTFRLASGEGQYVSLMATSGNAKAFLTSWNGQGNSASNTKVWMYTDRPIYRPGDRASFKGIVRALQGDGYAMGKAASAKIEVRDPSGTIVDQLNLPVTDKGSFDGSIQLEKDVTGSYEVHALVDGAESSMWINVASYRKPEFKISVKPDQPFYVRGDKVRFKIHCEYYFGGPVAGASLNGDIFRDPVWDWGDIETELYEGSSDEGGGGGEYFTHIETMTDRNGDAWVEFDSTAAPDDQNPKEVDPYVQRMTENNDLTYSLQISGSESGDRYFEGSGSVRVNRGLFSVIASPGKYVCEPGEAVDVEVKCEANQDGKRLGNVKIAAAWGTMESKDGEYRMVTEGSQTLTTDASGVATLNVKPDRPGDFVVRAEATDDRGNVISSEAWTYCYQGGAETAGSNANLEILVDKKIYRPGDSAVALIRTNKVGGSALVTLESNHIYWSKVLPISSKATKVNIPMTADLAPAALVCVAYVKDKQFMEARRRVTLVQDERKLNVEVKADKEVLMPGDTVEYLIKTTKSDGSPVSADVSLGVVDESIFAIREDRTDPLKAFYPMRNHEVATEYSFPEIYLDGGDKSSVSMEIRQNFQDTADWVPSVQTDADGEARVPVRLPDNLTSWRATAMAFTTDTEVGKGMVNVRVRKPLMARLSLPQFLVQKDQLRVSGLVTNDSGQAQSVSVRLDAKGVTLSNEAQQTIQLADGETKAVYWNLTAGDPGEAQFTMTALAGSLSDGLLQKLHIKALGRKETSFDCDELTNKTELTVDRKGGATEGKVTLKLAPSIAASLVDSLDGLVDYPYGCVEQTMSRFMPALLVQKTLDELHLTRPALAAKIPEVTKQSLARLTKMQTGEGGWGWWEHDSPDTRMTALVLEGLWRARGVGAEIPQTMIDRALEWADRTLKDEPRFVDKWQQDNWYKTQTYSDRVYLASSVVRFKASENALAVLQKTPAAMLNSGATSKKVLALNILGANYKAQRDQALAELVGRANVTDKMLDWDGEGGSMETAAALEAIAAVNPQDPRLAKVVRSLMLKRIGYEWDSTQATAAALPGLCAYAKLHPGSTSSYQATVLLNGKQVFTGMVSPDSTGLLDRRVMVLPIADLTEGKNTIQVISSGQAGGYYALYVEQTPMREIMAAESGPGVKVERTYHLLEAQQLEDGSMRLMPSRQSLASFQSGVPVRCIVRVRLDRPMSYVLIEVPLPSNMRVTDQDDPEYWGWWWSGTTTLDDRVALFAREMAAGDHEFEINMRAEFPGKMSCLPVTVYEMYNPARRAYSASSNLEVTTK